MRVYLDWNATAPMLPAAADAMREAARTAWANPASVHQEGRAARAVVEDARAAVAALSGADPRDVIFTSGGTEANNLALASACAGGVLLATPLEHPSVARFAERLAPTGGARFVRATAAGRVDLAHLEEELARGDVACLALQAVNHETGCVQPIAEAAALVARARGPRGRPHLHVDAVQAWGRVQAELGVADSLALAGHKLRGPKGIGALVVRAGVRIAALLAGGGQERGIRPGTVDPLACAGLAVAARHALASAPAWRSRAPLRDALEAALVRLGGLVNGEGPRAPHVTNVAFPAAGDGPSLVAALDLAGVAVSSGSACSAGTMEPSAVIEAMHGRARAAASVRISLGEETTEDEVGFVVRTFEEVLARAVETGDEGVRASARSR